MKKSNSRYLVVSLIIGFFIALIVIGSQGLFSVTGVSEPTCSFSGVSSDVCVFNYTVPADREMSLLTLNLSFEPVSSTEVFGSTSLSPFGTVGIREDNTDDVQVGTYYAYRTPSSWDEPYAVQVKASGTNRVVCDRHPEKGRAYTNLFVITKPYTASGVNVCTDAQCDADPAPYLVEKDRNDDGTDYYTLKDVSVLGSAYARCYISSSEGERGEVEDISDQYTLEGVVGNSNVFGGSVVFAVEAYTRLESGAFGSVGTPSVTASYYKAVYPSDVSYGVDGVVIDTLAGQNTEGVVSLDVSSQINSACDRSSNVSECVVQIEFSSSSRGNMFVSVENEVLRVAQVDDTTGSDSGTDTTTGTDEDTTTGTDTNTDTDSGVDSETQSPTTNEPTTVIEPVSAAPLIIGGIVIIGGGLLVWRKKK